ncbi:MoaD/ThiS family protein [Chloroflexota bacterium]
MRVKVKILSPFGINQDISVESGSTIRSCLKQLERKHIKPGFLDAEGGLLSYFAVAINKEIIREDELDRIVESGDELSIIFMELGG